jgi:hypothetical protein
MASSINESVSAQVALRSNHVADHKPRVFEDYRLAGSLRRGHRGRGLIRKCRSDRAKLTENPLDVVIQPDIGMALALPARDHRGGNGLSSEGVHAMAFNADDRRVDLPRSR